MRSAVFVACSIVLLFMIETTSAKGFFAAVSGMEVLLKTTKQIIDSVKKYLSSQQEILTRITRVKEEYERFHERALGEKQSFLENSFNQYLLMKRLTVDWKNLQHLIFNSTNKSQEILLELVFGADLQWPDDGDLSEVKEAVIRLQEIYGLNITDIVKGIALNSNSSFTFNADDCEEIGHWAYENEQFEYAFSWLREALLLRKANDDHEHMLRNNVNEIVKKMFHSAYMSENRTEFLLMAAELIDLERSKEQEQDKFTLDNTKYYKNNNLLCRGHHLRDPSKETNLHCRQQVSGHPYLLLQIIKEEELNLDPRIVIYHDILSEGEMEIIKELAKHKLEVSGIGFDGGYKQEGISTRVSKTAWLDDNVHEVVLRLNRRISDITGLATDTAEHLQVANYGTGGHYLPHFDYFYKENEPDNRLRKSDERIATWLNYMSDVQEGGATVFPLIGIRVQPEKGSALFWYNLRKSGNGDVTTLHCACPVLAGSKWVANMWLHETGQEFRRPCSLDPSE